jgi:hypothetical protein
MQEAYLRQMKTAIRDQAFDFASESVLRHRGRRRGQAAQGPTPGYGGWGGRWYPVDSVFIAYAGRTLLS